MAWKAWRYQQKPLEDMPKPETIQPRDLSPDEHNALQLSNNRERESWKDTFHKEMKTEGII